MSRYSPDHVCDPEVHACLAYYDLASRVGHEQLLVEKAVRELLGRVQHLENLPLGPPEPCITVPRRLKTLENRPFHLIHGQVWRWPHLKSAMQRLKLRLQPIPWCFAGHQMEICLTPSHYKRRDQLYVMPLPNASWASIAYYEKGSRLGEVYFCDTVFLQVKCGQFHTDGASFNLEEVTNASREQSTVSVRHQIGCGISLHYVKGHIFVELLSECELFINSKFHNRIKKYAPATICRLSPYGCKLIRVMRDDEFHNFLNAEVQKGAEAVYDLSTMCTLRMSFVEGWSEEVPVTDMPCWIEVRFLRHLRWLDRALEQMGAQHRLHF